MLTAKRKREGTTRAWDDNATKSVCENSDNDDNTKQNATENHSHKPQIATKADRSTIERTAMPTSPTWHHRANSDSKVFSRDVTSTNGGPDASHLFCMFCRSK